MSRRVHINDVTRSNIACNDTLQLTVFRAKRGWIKYLFSILLANWFKMRIKVLIIENVFGNVWC